MTKSTLGKRRLIKKQTFAKKVFQFQTLVFLSVLLLGVLFGLLALNRNLSYTSSAATGDGTQFPEVATCDDPDWFLYGECASQSVRNIFGGNSRLWRAEKAVNYQKARSTTRTPTPTTHYEGAKPTTQPTVVQRGAVESVFTPETFSETQEQSRYPSQYWGPYGSAAKATILSDGSRIWGPDWFKPLKHEDMIFNFPNYEPPDYRITRSVENWWRVVNHFNLDHPSNARYQPADGKTFCNIALGDMTRAFGVWIPHWYQETGETKPRELRANDIYDQLLNSRKFWTNTNDEWVHIPREAATRFANYGVPVVMVVRNNAGPGHVGLVAPNEKEELYIAQAGRVNGVVAWDEQKYANPDYEEPLFMVNRADYGDE